MFRRKKNPYKDLEARLGYSFKNAELLTAALTHRSFRFETPGVDEDNQRLEFLGDAVLGCVAAAHVYESLADEDEGGMTRLRSQVTSGRALARIAERLELSGELRVGVGEERSGGRKRSSSLADALEAVLGAAYLDGGIRAVEKIFAKSFVREIEDSSLDAWAGNPKGRLQEMAQRRWRKAPQYHMVGSSGPSHSKVFEVEVVVNDVIRARGKGRNKREAEARAASAALEHISTDE